MCVSTSDENKTMGLKKSKEGECGRVWREEKGGEWCNCIIILMFLFYVCVYISVSFV